MTKRLFINVLVIMLIVTTLLPISLAANRDVKAGTLTMLQGDVYVAKGGGKREIKAFEGMGVTEGDHVRTSKKASVKVVLDGENEILLGANTEILISELMGDNTVIKQKSGSLWSKVKSLFNIGDRFEVETPTSIMGVRGTHFFVKVDQQTSLSVFDGAVSIQRPRLHSTDSVVEEMVEIDEQVSTEADRTLSTLASLDIVQFVQDADAVILVQAILDELEASEERERKSREHDDLNDAAEEAYLASLLAHIAQAIMKEIEDSNRYQEVSQSFRDRDLTWEDTERQVLDTVQQTEKTKAELDRVQERHEAIQDKIDRYHHRETTHLTRPIPVRPPASGDDQDEDEDDMTPGETIVSAPFMNGWAEASGTYNGINYTLSIPQEPGDGETIRFTLHDPPVLSTGAGPVHALDITGLEDRKVELTLSIPEDLSDEPQAYHYEGDGRWEPRDTIINRDGTITFTTTLSAVAVAAKVPSPTLEGEAALTAEQQYRMELGWSEIMMDGIGYQLYRSTDAASNPEKIWSTNEFTEKMYIDTVPAGQSYVYMVQAVRAGFESLPSNEISLPVFGTVSGEVTQLNSLDQPALTDITMKVWDETREQIVARGTTDAAGQYSLQVPIGGPYRITAEHIEEAGHAYELYEEQLAVADLFLKHEGFYNSDPYMFFVQQNDDTAIPEFSIVPYERIEHLTGEESTDQSIVVTWDAYPEADYHRVYIFGGEYVSASSGYMASAQSEMDYEFGVAAWKDGVPLAIGYIEFRTDPVPLRGTVTGAVYSEADGYLANVPIKVWNQERTKWIDADQTDEEGQFTLSYTPVAEDAYTITAEYQGQVYELRYESGKDEYIALSPFTEPALSADYPPYVFSVFEDEVTDIGEIVLSSDPAGPTRQIGNFRFSTYSRDSITVRWAPEQNANFDRYRILVNGEVRGEVEENDIDSTTFIIEDLEPNTFYEISVGLWETNADRAAAAAMILVKTSLPWQ